MDRRLSIYLDLLRFVASMLVVQEHAAALLGGSLQGHTVGREAVVVFFVLSGFVISHITAVKEKDWRRYAAARFSRMYSVIPIAILVTVLVDWIGLAINSQWYVDYPFSPYNPSWGWAEAFRYLTFTNELWTSHAVLGTNEPYWSLGFEVPYYILFGIILFSRRMALTLIACGLWSRCLGPRLLCSCRSGLLVWSYTVSPMQA